MGSAPLVYYGRIEDRAFGEGKSSPAIWDISRGRRCRTRMRPLLAVLPLLVSCGPGLTLQTEPFELPGNNATHVFTGVVQYQQYDSWPLFRVEGDERQLWKILRRRIRVELVIRGGRMADTVDLYEISWTGGLVGEWDWTEEGARYLFFAKVENGRLRVVLDQGRKIFRILSGRHSRLPGNERMPMLERLGLLSMRPSPGWEPAMAARGGRLPAGISQWRYVKILRGFLRHSDLRLRVAACEELLTQRLGLDECWEQFDFVERSAFSNNAETYERLSERRWFLEQAENEWISALQQPSEQSLDKLRLLTTINDPALRRSFCAKFLARFPKETEHGCPADQPPPASIVTDDGDDALTGPWPTSPPAASRATRSRP